MTTVKGEAASVRVTGELGQWAVDLAARHMAGESAGTGLRIAAETLASLSVAELSGLVWTLPELSMMAEAAGQPLMSAGVGRGMLAADVEDLTRGLESMFADKYDLAVDELAGLVTRLWGLTPGQDWAVRDALSRWWASDLDPDPEGFRSAGLRVP